MKFDAKDYRRDYFADLPSVDDRIDRVDVSVMKLDPPSWMTVTLWCFSAAFLCLAVWLAS